MIYKKGKHVVSVSPEGVERRLASLESRLGADNGNPPIRGPPKRLRFADLVARGIVNNRVTLGNWIKKENFPAGQLTGPNSRTWGEQEVQDWLASRPTDPKPAPVVTKPEAEWKGRRGRRPRKQAEHLNT